MPVRTRSISTAANVLCEAYGRGVRSLNLLHVMTTLPPGTVRIDILRALDQLAVNQNTTDAALKNTFSFARAARLRRGWALCGGFGNSHGSEPAAGG